MQDALNLRVTAHARSLARTVYEGTSNFPPAERCGLVSQMRRAVVSIGSNICEGCGRHGDRELVHFLQIAYGSVSELQFQVLLATDLGLCDQERSTLLLEEVTRVKKMLSRLIKSLRAQRRGL
jgi:four helix bundle protein